MGSQQVLLQNVSRQNKLEQLPTNESYTLLPMAHTKAKAQGYPGYVGIATYVRVQ